MKTLMKQFLETVIGWGDGFNRFALGKAILIEIYEKIISSLKKNRRNRI